MFVNKNKAFAFMKSHDLDNIWIYNIRITKQKNSRRVRHSQVINVSVCKQVKQLFNRAITASESRVRHYKKKNIVSI